MSADAPTGDRAAAVWQACRVCGQVGSLPAMVPAERPVAGLAQQVVAARPSLDALLLRSIDLEDDRSTQYRSARVEVDRLLRLANGRSHHRRVARPTARGTDR